MNNIALNNGETFKNALITKVLLKNGKTSEVITIFNNSEIGHEEMNIGIRTALERSHNSTAMKSTLYSIKDGKRKEVLSFEASTIKEYKPELDPTLCHHM